MKLGFIIKLSVKVLYVVFFSGEGIAIQVSVKTGITWKYMYYKDVVLKKLINNTIGNSFKHVFTSTW